MLYGVDVHDGYQAGLNFATLRQQGYTFAAVKLTQGTDYQRDQADDWVRAARAAGLIPGGYHWLTSADGAAQARWFYRKVLECGGPEGMLIQLDCEADGYGPQMRAWAAEWARLSGGHPFLIYSGGWWWPRTGGFAGSSLTPYLWNSHYLTADTDTIPDDPAAFAARIPADWWTPGYGGWSTCTFLQFTSRGDAGGLGNNVDLNVTGLTREQLLALTTSGDDMTPEQSARLNSIDAFTDALAAGASTYWLYAPDGTRASASLAKYWERAGRPVGLTPEQLDQIKAAAKEGASAVTVALDPAEVAKAVNDDAAARLKE